MAENKSSTDATQENHHDGIAASDRPGAADNSELERILKINLPVIVHLAQRSLPVARIMDFAAGGMIEFDKPVDEDMDLMINNKCIGKGQVVRVGGNYGLRITRIASIADTILALGS